jgi:hypothetical protein
MNVMIVLPNISCDFSDTCKFHLNNGLNEGTM